MMSDEWMKTSFFPLLPLDPDESSADIPSTISDSAPSQTLTSMSVKAIKSPCNFSSLPSTHQPSSTSNSALIRRSEPSPDTSYNGDRTLAPTTPPSGSTIGNSSSNHPPEVAPPPSDVQAVNATTPLSDILSASPVQPSSLDSSLDQKLTSAELVMFNKIISSGCIIKSQQLGEPDLSHSQLCNELAVFLHQRPGYFLMRYGKYLDSQDLGYFDNIPQRSDFEVNFRLQKLRQATNQSSRSKSTKIRNRRYEYLRHLMEESSYFSEEEMRQRNPLLYDFYIGQYLSEEEKERDGRKNTDMTLSSMILNKMDQDKTVELFRRQRKSEMEELSLDRDDLTGCEAKAPSKKPNKSLKAMELNCDPAIGDREKFMLRQEFLAAMQSHFLDGKDEGFDYSKIDNDEMYDSLDMRERDEQDHYFDDEEPSWWDEEKCDDANMEVT